jgi:hypothetical protein
MISRRKGLFHEGDSLKLFPSKKLTQLYLKYIFSEKHLDETLATVFQYHQYWNIFQYNSVLQYIKYLHILSSHNRASRKY